MDVEHGERVERVEADLAKFIEKRHDQRVQDEGGRKREEIWAASVERHNAARQRQLCWEWLRYHQRQLTNRERIVAILDAHDRAEIRRYESMLQINHEGGDAA